MDPRYGERYRELFEKHWWWRARSAYIIGVLNKIRPAHGWDGILDVGCGDGLFFDQLAHFGEVEGLESCGDLISNENPYRHRIHICPFDENFRPGKKYSLILMLDVLEHLSDPVAALRLVRSLLSPQGMFVATVPALMSLWTNHDVMNHHYTRYNKRRIKTLAIQNGFDVKAVRYFYHWTCPIKFAQALFERVVNSEPHPAKIPPTWLNNVAFHLSRIEQRTFSRVPIPFGSSLLLIATAGN